MKKLILFLLCFHVLIGVVAQNCYNTRLNKGIELFNQKKFEDAKKRFEDAKQCPDKPDNGLEILNKWIEKCKTQPVKKLEVSPSGLTIISAGGYGSLSIASSDKWQVENLPSWCQIQEETSTTLNIYCEENKEIKTRSDEFKIVMGNKSKIIRIKQDAAKIPTKYTGKINFRITPNYAFVDFGTGERTQLTSLSTEIEKEAKEYNVKITKDKYFPIDTLITVPNDGSTKIIDIALKPKFATIQFDITTADGLPFQEYPAIKIGANKISYDNTNLKYVDDAENMEYLNLYKDGYIFAQPGSYNIAISADGFEEYTQNIQATQGDTSVLKIALKPISGYLSILDKDGAIGAKVFLNDLEIGTVPLFKKEVRIGTYTLRFEKENFLTPEKDYSITIKDKKEEEFHALMTTFKLYRFTSNPSLAEIFVNGNREGFTPTNITLKEGHNEVVIKKAGYWDYRQLIAINEGYTGQLTTIDVELQPTFPVKITSEENSINIVIKKGKEVILSKVKTPAEIQLPYGEYRIELQEYGKKRYSGNFVHNNTHDTTIVNVPFYSWGTFTALVGNYFAAKPEAKTDVKNGQSANYYNLLANFHFGRFNILPGLSTSIIRTSMFTVNSDFKGMPIDAKKNGTDINIDNKNYPNFMFSTTCLFLNGEFRIGGYFFKHLGVCALGTYAWYPNTTSFISLPQISGHEVFVGIEVTSRISYFNVNFKLGKEIYKGNYNFLINKDGRTTTIDGKNYQDNFYSTPFNLDGFAATIGFTLGRKISRGNNMLRVW